MYNSRMTKLKPYWFKSGLSQVALIPDLERRYDKGSHILISPVLHKWQNPGACLFPQLEFRHGLVKVWIYSQMTAKGLKNAKDRDLFAYWTNAANLVEIPLEG